MRAITESLFPETNRYAHLHCWYINDIPCVQCFDAFAALLQNDVLVLYSIDDVVSYLISSNASCFVTLVFKIIKTIKIF